MIAEAGDWMTCWAVGLNQSTHGTWNTNAICNLHLATGAICRPGSGPMSLTGQPNAMGGREMGYMGPGLPGQRSVLAEHDRAFVEQSWGLPPGTIRPDFGPGAVDMFERLADGRNQGVLDHLHQPGRLDAQPQDHDRGAGSRRARHHPGHLPRHGHQPLCRYRAARRRCGPNPTR